MDGFISDCVRKNTTIPVDYFLVMAATQWSPGPLNDPVGAIEAIWKDLSTEKFNRLPSVLDLGVLLIRL